jgi:16S rRNA (guanine527-N7)-methyltransferase
MAAQRVSVASGNHFGPEEFQRATGVPRETLEGLMRYADLLVAWQARLNLIAPSTIPDLWRRHMLDSAQLLPLIEASGAVGPDRPLIDLGSGAGFPGLVLAIMGVAPVILIESDAKKCAFLRESSRVSGRVAPESVDIIRDRTEKLPPRPAGVVTARALAPLPQLLGLAEPFLTRDSICLFLKGQDVAVELTEATKYWNITAEQVPSKTDPTGTILCLRGVHRVGRDESAKRAKPGAKT